MTELDKTIADWREHGTPGPWHVRLLENFGFNIVHYKNGDKFDMVRVAKVRHEKTANLIAAAPAMADEIDRLRKLDEEYGRVEAAIVMSCPSFDGDSDHKNCGDRLIAAVKDLAARSAELETKLSNAMEALLLIDETISWE